MPPESSDHGHFPEKPMLTTSPAGTSAGDKSWSGTKDGSALQEWPWPELSHKFRVQLPTWGCPFYPLPSATLCGKGHA